MRKIDDLHDYQLTAVDHVKETTHCGLFLEMGLGKTVSTLTAIKALMYDELEINKVLVIAPKRVVESVWHSECLEWEHLKCLKVSRILGDAKSRLAALRAPAEIYCISRDNVAWLCGLYGGSMLPFDMLVIDELSSFKNPKSVRFKALKAVQPSFRRVVGLTGTPAPNGLIDLWSQLYLLDRGERLGKFIGNYRQEYFRPDKRRGQIVYNYKTVNDGETRIHEKISDICMSMKAEDNLKLPGRIENTIKIDLPKEVMDKYYRFEQEQVLRLFDGQSPEKGISVANAAALSNKLLQFANGAVYDDDKKYHEVHNAKLEALKEIIEDANGKSVLIAWTYKSDLERISNYLVKYKPVQLKTEENINDWNAGKIHVMTMHPASGGHGLNLQSGGHIIVWFGQTWSLELLQQFNARLDRQGQENPVIINKLVAMGTIDEDVIDSQNDKSENQEKLMQAVKARIKKYKK